jgi:histidinol dehydrogenase
MKTVRSGVKVGEKFSPMERVGVYIPGGTAPLVSTVLHTAGIASAAGVKEIVAITPPGNTHPAVLYAMLRAGVTEIWRLGGVYGVAALALGTQTIRKVEKICGPGNAYVTAAKKLLYGEVGIDLVAGPSEILIIADKSADPEFVAADLLSQAEHGSGLEQAVLVSTDRALINKVEAAVLRQRDTLSRQETIDRVLENGVFLIEAPSEEIAAQIANNYAPEHLEIQTENPERVAKMITAAGAVFLGQWTPESCGDFCAGPSHVLPTAGSAKKFNGLETSSFFRRTSLVKYSQAALKRDAEIIARFGAMEMLDAHGRAGTIRVKKR